MVFLGVTVLLKYCTLRLFRPLETSNFNYQINLFIHRWGEGIGAALGGGEGHTASGSSQQKEVPMATLTQPTTQAPVTLRNSVENRYLVSTMHSYQQGGKGREQSWKSKLARRRLAKSRTRKQATLRGWRSQDHSCKHPWDTPRELMANDRWPAKNSRSASASRQWLRV